MANSMWLCSWHNDVPNLTFNVKFQTAMQMEGSVIAPKKPRFLWLPFAHTLNSDIRLDLLINATIKIGIIQASFNPQNVHDQPVYYCITVLWPMRFMDLCSHWSSLDWHPTHENAGGWSQAPYQGSPKIKISACPLGNLYFSSTCLELFWTVAQSSLNGQKTVFYHTCLIY